MPAKHLTETLTLMAIRDCSKGEEYSQSHRWSDDSSRFDRGQGAASLNGVPSMGNAPIRHRNPGPRVLDLAPPSKLSPALVGRSKPPFPTNHKRP
jgi:hypothetical protein